MVLGAVHTLPGPSRRPGFTLPLLPLLFGSMRSRRSTGTGAWRGGLLAIRRISRCHPFGGHGVDLVPLEVRGRFPQD